MDSFFFLTICCQVTINIKSITNVRVIFRVFCKDLSTGLLLEEDIGDVGWTLRWAADNNTFLYTKVFIFITVNSSKGYCTHVTC